MLDTLDLNTLIKEGQHYRHVERRIWRRTIILTGIILVIITAAWFAGSNRSAALYQMTETGWVGHQFYGNPISANVSDTGVTWVQTDRDFALHRYIDGQWTDYDSEEIFGGEVRDYFQMDSHGDELWVVFQNKIAHFDGTDWDTFPDILPVGAQINSVAAGDYGVYLTDRNANVLIHYTEAGEWNFITAPMFQTLLPYANRSCQEFLTIYEGTDGMPWLTYCGLWRYDKNEWEKVNNLSLTRLLSATSDRVYLYDYYRSKIVAIDLTRNNYPTTAHNARDLGLIGDNPVIDILDHESGVIWISSQEVILKFGGYEAKPVAADDLLAQYSPVVFSANSQGSLWFVSYDLNQNRLNTIAFTVQLLISGVLGPVALILVFLFSYMFPRLQLTAQRTKITRDLLPYIVDNFKQYIPQEEPAERVGTGQGCLVLVIAIGIRFFNQSQGITGLASILILFGSAFLLTAYKPIGRALNRSLDAETLRYHRKTLMVNSIVLLFIMVFLETGGAIFINMTSSINPSSPVTVTGIFFVPITTLLLVWGIGLTSIYNLMMRPALHGHYDVSLARIKRFKKVLPLVLLDSDVLRAMVLLIKGEGQAAKQLWASRLVAIQNTGAFFVSAALNGLSEALEIERLHEEALPLLEGMAKIMPDNPMVYRELAQHYLYTQTYPERALIMTDVMLMFMDKRKLFSFETAKRSVRVSELATRAWALAEAQRFDEAHPVLLEAKQENHGRYATVNAFLLRIQGKILLRWNKPEEALQVFKEAEQIDLQGCEGKMAGREVQKLRETMSTSAEPGLEPAL